MGVATRTRSPERAQFLTDVLSTALEGGIQYWADVETYRWYSPGLEGGTADHEPGIANAYATIREDDGDKSYDVTVESIASALGTLRAGPVKGISEDRRRDIIANDRGNGEPDGDHQDIDADLADCIVQIACFGEVVYG